MVQFIAMVVLYSLRAKNGYLDIREWIVQPPFSYHSRFWKCSPSVKCFSFKRCGMRMKSPTVQNIPPKISN